MALGMDVDGLFGVRARPMSLPCEAIVQGGLRLSSSLLKELGVARRDVIPAQSLHEFFA